MAGWKKILVAVDETETSTRALNYLGSIAGSTEGLEVTLLHVYPEPPPYYYREGHSLADYRAERERTAESIFAKAVEVLGEHGIAAGSIATVSRMTGGNDTISKAILEVRAEGRFGTVVVGKRGVSKAEEFLFGSISNTVVRQCNEFTVWVVG